MAVTRKTHFRRIQFRVVGGKVSHCFECKFLSPGEAVLAAIGNSGHERGYQPDETGDASKVISLEPRKTGAGEVWG